MSNMFVRIGAKKDVNRALKMLEPFEPKTVMTPDMIRVYAPDGDIVLRALSYGNAWLISYHREVFDEES